MIGCLLQGKVPGTTLPSFVWSQQLFAAGWSASFDGAMAFAARKMRIALLADLARYIESQA
jgi:organic hydroperoxide reductase OsmC/OhrA